MSFRDKKQHPLIMSVIKDYYYAQEHEWILNFPYIVYLITIWTFLYFAGFYV